ncbi:adenosine-specific kinase [Thermosphaera chiliense]|uniref:Adenosine-specific kinase n=1 Tax=Thermosphaera chiliense TaxID=3402707 RepID=A0A7M1URX3_9CREN|nr:adenosine-specific kinase [Thermosphaera aggregans]QOR94941.1 adenosine-specific kinase [Thermosphaera aggregans]
MSANIRLVTVKIPEGTNVIIGRSHFIKTVEDIYEALVTSVPGIRFGVAFNEASGKRLIRYEGNDPELVNQAIETSKAIGAGHTFTLFIRNAYPINVLNQLKNIQEIVQLYVATANPVQVIVMDTDQGSAIIGVVDGYSPLGVESEEDKKERHSFLRKIGYKK